jgi:hypothetical protein
MGKLFDKIRRVQDKTRPFCTAIIPAAATSSALIYVGLLMLAVLLDSFKKDKTAEPKADEDGAA